MSESEEPSGFVPPDIDELSEGLPGYEFIDLLACGGMGAVYRARQTSLDRMVAIKILPPELAVDETFRKSFEAEGKAMAKVSHSNLVGVFNLGEVNDMLYLVMEFVEGSTLYESKGDEAIDPETAVTLIRSVASGLAEAHRHDLVHRDIKPANIFINHDLVPKLGDFGLAVPDSDIESGLMMGTPAYLAPEVMANPMAASFASDTYALGVILYEMLTGRSIERGDELDLNIIPNLGELPKIVRKALNPQPLLRYQTAEALEDDLRDWLRKPKSAGLAVNPGARVLQQSLTPSVSGESVGGGGGLLALVAIAAVVGASWFFFAGGLKGGEDDSSSDSAAIGPDEVPEDMQDPGEEASKTLEELRANQQKELLGLIARIAEERTKNRLDFLQAAGTEGESFMKLVVAEYDDLPRHFLPGETEVSEGLYQHVQEFVISNQKEIDQKYEREIYALHRKALKELRSSKVEFPKEVGFYWERWIEWLGQTRSKALCESPAAVWFFSSNQGDLELHLSSTGKKVIIIGEQHNEGPELYEVSADGEISVQVAGDTTFNFPWKLRRQGDRLEGTDALGEKRVLRKGRFNYADLVKVSDEPLASPSEMRGDQPEEPAPVVEMFQDPQVASLTRNYQKALNEKIESLESGYLRVLKGFLESYQETGVEVAIKQIESEMERVQSIAWRKGFIQLAFISEPGELPSEVKGKRDVFVSEFKKRYEPMQRTYRVALEKMLRDRKARRNPKVEDIEAALKNLETPKGSVMARFVKIVSLKDEGRRDASIAMIDILDLKGNRLPIEKFTNVKASSFEEREPDGSLSTPKCAIDGNPNTFWQTAWKRGTPDFPHWLSFDLGGNHLITGFILTPRVYRLNRYGDFTNWRFYVSDDGRKWKAVAAGGFPTGNQPNEHRGFEEIE